MLSIRGRRRGQDIFGAEVSTIVRGNAPRAGAPPSPRIPRMLCSLHGMGKWKLQSWVNPCAAKGNTLASQDTRESLAARLQVLLREKQRGQSLRLAKQQAVKPTSLSDLKREPTDRARPAWRETRTCGGPTRIPKPCGTRGASQSS